MSEISETIYEMRIEEAADAVVSILDPIYSTSPEMTVAKAILLPKIAKFICEDRRKDGYNYQRTVENHLVREPNEKFIINHWTTICLYCADQMSKYIVWDQDGVRLGTLQEYQELQDNLSNIADGVASSYNRRSTIINKRGGESVFLNVTILQLPEGD